MPFDDRYPRNIHPTACACWKCNDSRLKTLEIQSNSPTKEDDAGYFIELA